MGKNMYTNKQEGTVLEKISKRTPESHTYASRMTSFEKPSGFSGET